MSSDQELQQKITMQIKRQQGVIDFEIAVQNGFAVLRTKKENIHLRKAIKNTLDSVSEIKAFIIETRCAHEHTLAYPIIDILQQNPDIDTGHIMR